MQFELKSNVIPLKWSMGNIECTKTFYSYCNIITQDRELVFKKLIATKEFNKIHFWKLESNIVIKKVMTKINHEH